LRKKEITEYQESVAEIMSLDEQIIQIYTELDTTKNDSNRKVLLSEILPLKLAISEHLYNLGELEAFHFKRSDSSMIHFQRIIEEFSDSETYSKALFVMYYLYNQMGDSAKSMVYSDKILDELPRTDYADYLRKSMDLPADPGSVQSLLRQGELQWLIKPKNALAYYKEIIQKDSTSETSARAAYFLAYHYDYTFSERDSALKYYALLQDRYENSEQAMTSRDRFTMLTLPLSEVNEVSEIDQTNTEENHGVELNQTMIETKRDSIEP